MSTSHLINANSHRAKEGARVIEDIARFVLRDESLFNKIREIRHQIYVYKPTDDMQTDIGGIDHLENNVRSNLLDIIQANFLRLEEALRVLEEFSPVIEKKQLMKKLRYQTYDCHSYIYSAAKKYLKSTLLSGLYLVVDTDVISHPLEKIIDIINQSPVNIVQYRNKSPSKKTVFDGAYQIKQQLDPNKLLIINDHIDIALDLGDGVHLGQDDYPLDRIRTMIPNDFILGISTHNTAEAFMAAQCGASYIAFGCLFATNSKRDTMPVSIAELKQICNSVSLPVCGIGGITHANLENVLSANAKMAALISYVWKTDNPLQMIKNMHEMIIGF